MTRAATKAEILQAVQLLSALRRPKDMPAVVLDAYEIALKGVSALALNVVTENMLQGSVRFMPSPAELRLAINEIEHQEDSARHAAKAQQFEEDNILTPGQKLGYPLLKEDPLGRQRASDLWATIRPTLGFVKSFDDAEKDMAELRRQHQDAIAEKQITEAKKRDQERYAQSEMAKLSDAERLERIRQIGHEPVQPTEALLRALKNPMNPPKA